MNSPISRVFVFLLIVLGVYLWIGYSITALTGSGDKATTVVEITPEGGEAIYWGKGRCFTCHSVGGQGSAVRGPNHGQFGEKFQQAMGARATERAAARTEKEGVEFTAVDYIVESLASPGAFVVEGYKNEMAVVYAPPISLNLKEIKAIVSYMMSLGGDLDMEAIDSAPSEITAKLYSKISAAAEAGGGDPELGAEVYEDNCVECHALGEEEDGEIGPNLSGIAATGLKFISESILAPAKSLTKGYETYVVINNEGRQFIGLKTRDGDGEVDITNALGDVETIAKADIKEIRIDDTLSIMPDDISEVLTVKEYQDVLSFLMLQKPAQEE
ncbi:MAG: c-type cytochrome [Hyphomicrobiales bacterium]|nr:c-type cytochrome [Hyphomicrobiales bacterium]